MPWAGGGELGKAMKDEKIVEVSMNGRRRATITAACPKSVTNLWSPSPASNSALVRVVGGDLQADYKFRYSVRAHRLIHDTVRHNNQSGSRRPAASLRFVLNQNGQGDLKQQEIKQNLKQQSKKCDVKGLRTWLGSYEFSGSVRGEEPMGMIRLGVGGALSNPPPTTTEN